MFEFNPHISTPANPDVSVIKGVHPKLKEIIEELEGEKMVYKITDTKIKRICKEAYNRGITKAIDIIRKK